MRRTDAVVYPEGQLALLSQQEVAELRDGNAGPLHETLRRCALAVMHFGEHTDNAVEILREFEDFDVEVLRRDQGAVLQLRNAPATAFVDGRMIRGIREHLFSTLRDLVYTRNEIERSGRFDLGSSAGITNAVFHILRNADLLDPRKDPRLVVCWGGHAIARDEYDYTKEVGHQLGLRDMNICTGCGPGAMKGPMKGAAISRAKQRSGPGRYLGITEPGIVAAEPPNPIVNELVIMPDIEKRLEAFLRVGQALVVFPGGVGTVEEILYLLGILLHPGNAEGNPPPVVFTGPGRAAGYFAALDQFIGETLGPQAKERYRILIDDPEGVAQYLAREVEQGVEGRRGRDESCHFNWRLRIDLNYQLPFQPTHANMAGLDLSLDLPLHQRAANLRRAFSGIVAGNVKPDGIAAVAQNGPFEIRGEPRTLAAIDRLLDRFIVERRMKINGDQYLPCYRLVG